MNDFRQLAETYRGELLDRVVPFWLDKSQDTEHGGYFTCLDRNGEIYDRDKFTWLQARQVWLFSMLCNRVEKRKEWIDCARQGGEFLRQYGHDGSFNWYFSLTREGRPLVQPYNIFSDTFAAMAFGQLQLATGEEQYREIALSTFRNILRRQHSPKGVWEKSVPGTREMKNFALPMILSNLALEIEHLLPEEQVEQLAGECIDQVMNVFYRPELDLVVENVTTDHRLSDTFDGRLITPGHAIEAMWFMMDLSEKFGKQGLGKEAVRIAIRMLEYGWDETYGGIYYFLDRSGHPVQQLEWSQKLWWVHLESAVAMLKSYRLTGEERCLEWFRRIHDYNWSRFRDPDHPEWFGYLDRRGEINLPLKGGKWKGCFHVPRSLFQCWKTLELIACDTT